MTGTLYRAGSHPRGQWRSSAWSIQSFGSGNGFSEPMIDLRAAWRIDVTTADGERRYEIVELLTTEEMQDEGRAMRQCVGLYAGYCASRRTSIWSLRKQIESGRFIRLATIEVNNTQRFIAQVRGRLNKRPAKEDLAILSRRQNEGGPRLSRWLTT
jgi:hypothetical protein